MATLRSVGWARERIPPTRLAGLVAMTTSFWSMMRVFWRHGPEDRVEFRLEPADEDVCGSDAGCLLVFDQLRDDVRHDLMGGGMRTVAEAHNWVATVMIAHHIAEADYGAGCIAFHRRDGLINVDGLRSGQHRPPPILFQCPCPHSVSVRGAHSTCPLRWGCPRSLLDPGGAGQFASP